MSSESDVYSQGNLRYFRLGSILQNEGKLAVRSYFQTLFPGKSLSEYLDDSTVKSKLYSLWKHKKKMTNAQFDKLYPKSGQVNIETLDISLLFLLIRSLHLNISPQDSVWTKPNPGNLSGEADVSRITETRNRLWGHPETVDLSENDFLFEAKNLEMVITRLAKTVGNLYVDPFNLEESIKAKMSGKFGPRPSQHDVGVNTTASLVKEDDEKDEKKDVATSTSSLEKTRKTNVRSEVQDILPSNVSRKHSNSSNASSTDHANRSCWTFECIPKFHRRKYTHASCFRTNNHATRECRCLLAGVVRLKNGVTVVTDTTHNSVQAFDKNMQLICDIELSSPRGVCPMADNSVIITLNKSSKLMIFKIDDVIHYVDDVDISCDGWMYDVKYANNCAYVSCDKGDIHVIDLKKSTEERLSIGNDISSKIEFFDVSPSGDKIFLSDGRGVVCLDDRGAELWQYRGGRSGLRTTGVVSYKERVIVAAWEENRLIELTHAGKWVRKIGVDHVRSPMALSMFGGQVFVTQYMSDLNKDMCREVVTLRD